MLEQDHAQGPEEFKGNQLPLIKEPLIKNKK